MKKTTLFILILVIAVALVLVLSSSNQTKAPADQPVTTTTPAQTNQAPTNTATTTESQNATGTSARANQENIVTYTENGFSPSSLTIQQGETVTFRNESSSGMWVASAVHPTHTRYDGTSLNEHCTEGGSNSFDACKGITPGKSWSFTFDKAGEWNYHNHSNASHTGTIVVE
ncbi:MAG: cupredoxin domain-containing protein [Candidatus Magasanikbacteria bacterium]